MFLLMVVPRHDIPGVAAETRGADAGIFSAETGGGAKISAAASDYYKSLNSILDQKLKRYENQLKLIKKRRKVEQKREEIRFKSSPVTNLRFRASIFKKRAGVVNDLKKEFSDLDKELRKMKE